MWLSSRARRARALELGKPLVVLKIGSSERGRAAALGHTGSLVGDDQVWDAFFERFHITRVRDLDEFIETLALFAAGFAPDGPRLGLIGTSGGKAGYYADLCESIGVTLADLDEATIAAIGAILGPDSPGLNPVDSGVGGVSPRKLEECLLHLCRDPGVDVVGVYGDMPVDITRFPGYQGYCDNAIEAARTVAGQSDKPIVLHQYPLGANRCHSRAAARSPRAGAARCPRGAARHRPPREMGGAQWPKRRGPR